MKPPKSFLQATAIAACIATSDAAITFSNGDFEASTTSLSPWTTAGTTAANTSDPIAGSVSATIPLGGGNTLVQDFTPTAADELFNFMFTMQFRLDSTPVADTNNGRIRIRGENGQDLITLAFDNNSVRSFSGAFADDLAGLSIAAETPYWLRVVGTDLDLSTRSFELGFSTDGVNWSTQDSTRFHSAYVSSDPVGFGRIVFDGTTNGMTVDSVSVVPIPEPAAALLGCLGVVGLLRRRR